MRPTLAPPRDTECIDIPHGPKIETFFIRDLPRTLSEAYRVQEGPRRRGILGTSAGGYCSLKLAMRHPEVYSAAAALGGHYRAIHDSTTGDLFGGNPRLAEENNLFWLLKRRPAPQISALVTSTRRGEKNYRDTLRFVDAVKPPMKVSSLILGEGGPNFRTWTIQLPAVLTWLDARLSQ